MSQTGSADSPLAWVVEDGELVSSTQNGKTLQEFRPGDFVGGKIFMRMLASLCDMDNSGGAQVGP